MTETLQDKRILISLLVILLIATSFWTGSRYPALDEKATMGGDIQLEDSLGFDPVFVTEANDSTVKRIAITAFNWANTNKKGMAFGILFAAAFMTILSFLGQRSFKSGIANTLMGITIGAPLGVCVNCAAPIGRGMHIAGARLETTLATIISSPTLNVIVLTMMISLFPFYLVAIKIGATLLFLLVLIPLMCRLAFNQEPIIEEQQAGLASHELASPIPNGLGLEVKVSENWSQSAHSFLTQYGKNLWFIAKATIPLMLLAGLLGATLVTFVPWEMLSTSLENTSIWQKLIILLLLAIFGLFVPVPIAFDVIISATLYSAGMPAGEVMVLLFTLGSFSIYSYLIIGRAVSWYVAGVVSAVLILLGVGTGIVAEAYSDWDSKQQNQMLIEALRETKVSISPASTISPVAMDDKQLVTRLQKSSLNYLAYPDATTASTTVERRAALMHNPGDDRRFHREPGSQLGFYEHGPILASDRNLSPYLQGIATGDVHGDGWVDVLFSSPRGIFLYANEQGRKFTLQQIAIPHLNDLNIAAIDLVDLNNDGWLDIFLSAVRDKNYIIYNAGGRFVAENVQTLPDDPASFANAVGFGDLDRDGDLDIVLGNFNAGIPSVYLEESRNIILRQERGQFKKEPLPGMTGQTLVTLLSDINQDGTLDLLVGEDFVIAPATYYMGDDRGQLRPVKRSDKIFPFTTPSTMSIDSADIDNDLDLEIYIAQISPIKLSKTEQIKTRSFDEVCDTYDTDENKDWVKKCRSNVSLQKVMNTSTWRSRLDIGSCQDIEDHMQRMDCVVLKTYRQARQQNNPELCGIFPEYWTDLSYMCGHLSSLTPPTEKELNKAPQQRRKKQNVLFTHLADGNHYYTDIAKSIGLENTGWSWNAQFADLDNNEWQDIYIANGMYNSKNWQSNLFFTNQQGRKFKDITDEIGLSDFLPTLSYSYIDIDNDGDLDIITVPIDGTPWVYWNQYAETPFVAFELHDKIGNRSGIGSRIIIHYGENEERHQIREIKGSGGYLSSNELTAFFGLGKYRSVKRVEITWSTGEMTELMGDFKAGERYRVTRKSRI